MFVRRSLVTRLRILMSLSGMVQIPCLQAKKKSVMPAQAGIQCGGGGEHIEPGFPL